MADLFDRIRARVAAGRPNDYPNEFLPALPPTAAAEVAAAEGRLGFRLPDVLRRLYTEVANGGVGPAFGLIPLSAASLPADAPAAAAEFDLVREYLRLANLYAPHWPAGLVPAFYGGCTVFEFVDGRDPAGPVLWFDPGTEDVTALADRRPEAVPSLAERLEAWLAGKELW